MTDLLPFSLQGTGVGSDEQNSCGHSVRLQRALLESDRQQGKPGQLPAILREGEHDGHIVEHKSKDVAVVMAKWCASGRAT